MESWNGCELELVSKCLDVGMHRVDGFFLANMVRAAGRVFDDVDTRRSM